MTNHFVTLFDRNYLTRGLAMYRSLRTHIGEGMNLYVVCLDELSRTLLKALNLPGLHPVALHEIECAYPELNNCKLNRTMVEYYWTLTPILSLFLLERHQEIDFISHLDADLYFYQPLDAMFQEIGNANVAIHEHRFPKKLERLLENGRFNVGLVCFRRTDVTMEILRTWKDQTIEWCYQRCEPTRMGDQKYLDVWPTKYPGVHILQHPGVALAPWNAMGFSFSQDMAGKPLVNGSPVLFYHFHSLVLQDESTANPIGNAEYAFDEPIFRLFYKEYLEELDRALSLVRQVLPSFAFGYAHKAVESGVPVIRKVDREWSIAQPAKHEAEIPKINLDLPEELKNGDSLENALFVHLAKLPFAKSVRSIVIVGAYLYEERELFRKVFPSLETVVLFEALPNICDQLRSKVAGDSKVKVLNYAVGDREGTAVFNVTNNVASSSLLPLKEHKQIFPDVSTVGTVEVPCGVLESLLAQNSVGIPDVLFLDVQGAEHSILKTLSKKFREQCSVVYTEVSKSELYEGARSFNEVIELLRPEFEYVAFGPLIPETLMHGNALFLSKRMLPKISLPSRPSSPIIEFIVPITHDDRLIEGFLRSLIAELQGVEVEAHITFLAQVPDFVKERLNSLGINSECGAKISLGAGASNFANTISESSASYCSIVGLHQQFVDGGLSKLVSQLNSNDEINAVYGANFASYIENDGFSNSSHVKPIVNRAVSSGSLFFVPSYLSFVPVVRVSSLKNILNSSNAVGMRCGYEFWLKYFDCLVSKFIPNSATVSAITLEMVDEEKNVCPSMRLRFLDENLSSVENVRSMLKAVEQMLGAGIDLKFLQPAMDALKFKVDMLSRQRSN